MFRHCICALFHLLAFCTTIPTLKIKKKLLIASNHAIFTVDLLLRVEGCLLISWIYRVSLAIGRQS